MEPISWPILAIEVITFLAGAAVVWMLPLSDILKSLQERRDRIAKAHSDADKARREAESLQKDLEKRVAKLEGEEKKRLAKADADARKLRDAIVAEAREQAAASLQQGREQMKRERAEDAEKIRREVAHVSVAMARQVSGAMLKAADRKRLVKKVLDQLPSRFEGKA
jgi:F-type H+-transporting ATPase subunit b